MAVHTLLKKNILIDMINEDYCSFEVAKLLKEKGFDWECETSYYISNEGCENAVSVGDFTKVRPWRDALIAAPTHQMAIKWLREENGVYIYVEPFITISSEGYNLEGYKPWTTTFKRNWFNPLNEIGKAAYTQSYEEAIEAALKFSLENLI